MQIADGGGPQNRAQLRAEHVGPIEAHAHAAQAEERVVFLRQRHVGERLVAADIERADDERTLAAERFGHRAIFGGLFVFRRRGVAVIEQELGAQQPDAFGARRDRIARFLRIADVRDHFDAMTIGRDRELARGDFLFFALLRLTLDALARLREFVRARIAPQAAVRAVEHDERAVGQLQRILVDAADRRNAERAREDRDVTRRAAGRRAEAEHLAAIERGGIGRRKLLGDQDRFAGHVDMRLLHAREQRQHAAADIADIARALAQQRVVELLQIARLRLERGAPREARALAFADAADGRVVEIGIVEQFEVRIENLRLRRIGQLRLQRLDLLTRFVTRRVEPCAFALRRFARFGHVDDFLAELHDLADRESRRRRYAGEFVRVGGRGGFRRDRFGCRRRPGAGASPGFSPEPDASRRASAAAASPASGPAASTRTLSPNFVASAISATTDFAFALSLPRRRRISDLYFFASAANTAAGRACRPWGFGSVTSSDRIAPAAPPSRLQARRRRTRPPAQRPCPR